MVIAIILIITSFFIAQSLFSLFWMLYAWENPYRLAKLNYQRKFSKPLLSFSALVPARFEEKVINDTIIALNEINYPDELKEVLVLCRDDDKATVEKVEHLIQNARNIKRKNIRLITFSDLPINKPHSLNIGLQYATNDIVVVFDAEDQPHKDIYSVANTAFQKNDISILQSGVQLINYQSRWFSILNVLEYYFWFKSGLHFFSKVGHIAPLAGNTVFFRKKSLQQIGGWDEECLTEDAEVTFRLLRNGGKIGVVYDEQHATLEETPLKLSDFVKQRTRWNQGFIQVLLKMEWLYLPSFRQKILSAYILLSPLTQSILLLYVPFALWVTIFYKLPLLVSFFSFVPFYLFSIQLFLYIFGFAHFNNSYKLHAPWWTFVTILTTFYPYQFILAFSAIRACYRNVTNKNQWEKTKHINLHRKMYFKPAPISYA